MSSSDDYLVFNGIVTNSCKGIFNVQIESGQIVNCTLSGKIKKNKVRVIVGDKVEINVSPYNPLVGRIVRRSIERIK